MKILNLILLIALALFSLSAFNSKLVFGHGIGDIVYAALAAVSFLIMFCVFAMATYKKRDKAQYTIAVISFLILLLLCLKATIFRGPEYPWSGHGIFNR